jgi:predicted GIY-YIG superfamily endonuclease
VYVIELDPTVIQDVGKGYVYVGETMKTPEQRFAEHKNRSRNGKTRLYSPVVAKHGKCLRMDIAPRTHLFDKQSSKVAEAEWAEHLRSLGYTVKGGH